MAGPEADDGDSEADRRMVDGENVTQRRLVVEADEERIWRKEIGSGREGRLGSNILSTCSAASFTSGTTMETLGLAVYGRAFDVQKERLRASTRQWERNRQRASSRCRPRNLSMELALVFHFTNSRDSGFDFR